MDARIKHLNKRRRQQIRKRKEAALLATANPADDGHADQDVHDLANEPRPVPSGTKRAKVATPRHIQENDKLIWNHKASLENAKQRAITAQETWHTAMVQDKARFEAEMEQAERDHPGEAHDAVQPMGVAPALAALQATGLELTQQYLALERQLRDLLACLRGINIVRTFTLPCHDCMRLLFLPPLLIPPLLHVALDKGQEHYQQIS